MKSKIVLIVIFTMAILFQANAEKHGLIIAIGDYPEEGGWPDISSENDVPHVMGAMKSLGIQNANITLMQDSKATKQGILDAFSNLSRKVSGGDFIMIHFSGHGQQMIDLNGDELDGLDEAIVPYNSAVYFQEEFNEGQYLITDDKLNEIITELRIKAGATGKVLLVLDSCHSGTGTRGFGRTRGTDVIMAPRGFSPSENNEQTFLGSQTVDSSLAPMASYFGASAQQLNYETLDDQSKSVGSLTYAVCSAISSMRQNMSFAQLFDKVRIRMKVTSPRQVPQWEGNSDIMLLDGKMGNDEILYPLNSKEADHLVVEVGTINGVHKGSIVEIVDMESGTSIVQGNVAEAGLSSSQISLVKEVEFESKGYYAVKVKKKACPPIKCTVGYESGIDNLEKIMEELSSNGIVEVNQVSPDLFISSCDDQTISLETRNGYIIHNSKLDRLNSQSLQKAIASFTQADFLRTYNSKSSKIKARLEIVSVDDQSNGVTDYSKIAIGEKIKLKVTNLGSKPFYYTVLDIQPDNQMNLLIPAVQTGNSAEDHYLEPDGEYITPYDIRIGEPAGSETLKLIVSKTPIDLGAIIQTKGAGTRGSENLSPLEMMFRATYQKEDTRGGTVMQPSLEDVGVESVFFEIIE